ncbi:60S ribosomal protein L3 [Histomonas meleagridis]|uniref:60S ribosomal protein L3 n=2 Tax=Histomonas meleagridis TaxID=135588 RepID=UPI00355A4D67|nr:60S ribosomal protein L3 [Histomonas meleagridis]KAH0791317.1 60S ribosomal protein L3 [Histomonas meleagridis]KAH0794216.1 60S ribosomal protein L3 [Histomonas meleagridis]KAH0801683.1 60S ribosomal protein L3 [Histomonas meleagridis]KAH0803244.1 60S ribosomal protein L3 [Histomonas meleagridis]
MSHRKYSAPRRGSLGFLPRGRASHVRGRIRSWPKDDQSKPPQLQAFLGYKAGMTHVVREVVRAGSRLNKKEAVEPVTLIETPPMVVVGLIGYKETVHGLKPVTTAWASFVGEEMKRCYYKNWAQSKQKKAFGKLDKKADDMKKRIQDIKEQSSVVRVIAHTQPKLVKLGSRKAELIEIQINGGDVAAKVDYAVKLLEKTINVGNVFAEGEQIDLISVGKGRGWEGVIHRFGGKRLQKKTHRGRRKVACIGPWHPMRVLWTIARAGNNGFHHRTEMNKRIYKLQLVEGGKLDESGSTEYDISKKSINPMGGFAHYGNITNDFVMIKGSVCGAVKRTITLRKTINANTKRIATEDINLKWIDTASKFGHGRFQTKEERNKFLGKLKLSKVAAEQKKE